MKNIIIQQNGGLPPSQKPVTMQELLDSAHNDWKFKRKDEAFAKVLNALVMVSVGTASAMKTVEELKARMDEPPGGGHEHD